LEGAVSESRFDLEETRRRLAKHLANFDTTVRLKVTLDLKTWRRFISSSRGSNDGMGTFNEMQETIRSLDYNPYGINERVLVDANGVQWYIVTHLGRKWVIRCYFGRLARVNGKVDRTRDDRI